MRFSVVLPTYRRPDLLRNSLTALTSQTLSASDYEIVVVDDGATSDTKAVVEEFAAKSAMPVRYIASSPPQQGCGGARNIGNKIAEGDILAYTDDDTTADPDWLANAAAAFDTRKLDAAWGRIIVPMPDKPDSWSKQTARLENAVFPGANIMVKRDVMLTLGGFDTSFTGGASYREDTDFYFRLLTAGYRVEAIRNAVVVHPVREIRWRSRFKLQQRFKYDALLFKKHPALYRQQLAGIRRLAPNYTIVALLIGMVIGAIVRLPPMTMLCAGLWLGLTSVYLVKYIANGPLTLSGVAKAGIASVVLPILFVYWRLYGALRFQSLVL